MKRSFYCVIVIVLLQLCSCGKTQDALVDMQKINGVQYKEGKDIADGFEIYSAQLPVNEENLGFYCVADSKIFYVVDYSDSLLDQTGTKESVRFEDKYNTQIHMYDMKKEEDMLLYKYDIDYCMKIFDIRTNGDRIVWVEQPKNGGWIMKTLNMGEKTEPQIIIDSTQISSDEINAAVPTMSEDKVYWYIHENGKKHPFSLYSYSFLTQEIQCEQVEIDLESPYEGFSLISEIGTLLKREDNEENIIELWDVKNSTIYKLNVVGEVSNPISNDYISVWMKNYESDETIYVYDRKVSEVSEIKLNPGRFFSYGIIGTKIFVNQREKSLYGGDGLICFDVEQKKYQQIMDTNQMFTIFQGCGNEIYTSVSENNLVTIVDIIEKEGH